MSLIRFDKGDTLILKKKHPCSSDKFTVVRTGSDVRIICQGCGRDMTLSREALEKSIKSVLCGAEENKKDD